MNWPQRLAALQEDDYGDRYIDGNDAHEEASNLAEDWMTCAVGENLNLRKGTNHGHIMARIMDWPELKQWGEDFAVNVISGDYDTALKLYRTIEEYLTTRPAVRLHLETGRKQK